MKTLISLFSGPSVLSTLQIFIAALGVLAILLGLHVRFRNRNAQHWTPTRGKIIFSQLQSSADNQYRLCVAFRYRVKKRSVDSHPVTVTVPAQPAQANRTLKRLAMGGSTVVYYDPAHPENVTLEDIPPNWLEAVAAGAALVMFAVFAF